MITKIKTHTTLDLELLDALYVTNHKGRNCIKQPSLLCQEGWCNECMISQEAVRKDKNTSKSITYY